METLMQLMSVNVGQARPLPQARESGRTGIYKLPAPGPVSITNLGVDGDSVCDVENHGGPDQAVFIYGVPDYDWWSGELGHSLEPGTFGENLTITGLLSAGFSIGDRMIMGPVVLEVTSPRIPCATLAGRMGDPTFVKRYRQAERPGFYCRVIQPGSVQPGDPVHYEPATGPTLTVLEMFRDYYQPHLSEAAIRRHLAAPIAIRARREKEARLLKLGV